MEAGATQCTYRIFPVISRPQIEKGRKLSARVENNSRRWPMPRYQCIRWHSSKAAALERLQRCFPEPPDRYGFRARLFGKNLLWTLSVIRQPHTLLSKTTIHQLLIRWIRRFRSKQSLNRRLSEAADRPANRASRGTFGPRSRHRHRPPRPPPTLLVAAPATAFSLESRLSSVDVAAKR